MSQYPILLHINCFEQGQTLERACRLTHELGADGLEFRRKPGAYDGSDLDYLEDVARACDQYPLDWVSFGAPGVNLINPLDGELEKELDAAETFYRRAAELLPVKVVNMLSGTLLNPDPTLPYVEYWRHGSAIATEAQWKSAVQSFRRLAELGESTGIRFAFETHGTYLHDTIDATMRLVDEINSSAFGVLWDQANLMLFPDAPSVDAAIRSIGDKLYYVHFKNWLLPPLQMLAASGLSSGIINTREQITRLVKSGYTGPLCIETPRAGDREAFIREDFVYLKSLVIELSESGNPD